MASPPWIGRTGVCAGLHRPVVELRQVEVAVAAAGRQGLVADADVVLDVRVVVDPGEDPLVVADDQPGVAGERVDDRDQPVLVGRRRSRRAGGRRREGDPLWRRASVLLNWLTLVVKTVELAKKLAGLRIRLR